MVSSTFHVTYAQLRQSKEQDTNDDVEGVEDGQGHHQLEPILQ